MRNFPCDIFNVKWYLIVTFTPCPRIDGGADVQIAGLPDLSPDTSISVGKGKENGHLYCPRKSLDFPGVIGVISVSIGDGGGKAVVLSFAACVKDEGRIKGVMIYSGFRSFAEVGRSLCVILVDKEGDR